MARDVTLKTPEEASFREDHSVGASMTVAVDHLGDPDVDARLEVLGVAPDAHETKVGLDEVIQKKCWANSPLSGGARVYGDPLDLQGSLRSRLADDFDECVVDLCCDKQHESYLRLAADLWLGGAPAEDNISYINGRPLQEVRLPFFPDSISADELGLDMSELEDGLCQVD